MADMFLFTRHGWKSIWKQNIIWLFSSFYLLQNLSNIFQVDKKSGLFLSSVSLLTSFVFSILFFVSYIGVPYLAYCFLIGKSVTFQETLFAVRKFAVRVLGFSCLGFLVFSPILIAIVVVSINSSAHSSQFSNNLMLMLLPLSIFTAMPFFTMIAFFENNWGLWKSLEKAWRLFVGHFKILATLGLILTIIFMIYSAISGIFTVLIQSGFNVTAISNLNLFNPYSSLNKNILYLLLNSAGQIIFIPLNASIFISAYLKYSDAKLPFQLRVR